MKLQEKRNRRYSYKRKRDTVKEEQEYCSSSNKNRDLGLTKISLGDLKYIIDYETYRILTRTQVIELLRATNLPAYNSLLNAYNNGYIVDIKVTKDGPYLWADSEDGEVRLCDLTWEDIDYRRKKCFKL